MNQDKLAWVNQATQAANKASSAVLLGLVGSDAESYGNKYDTMIVSDMQSSNQASEYLAQAMNTAGIQNLNMAMSGHLGAANTIASTVRTGLGGPSVWDSAKIQTIASTFARETNKELAGRQAKMMAIQAREQALEALKNFDQNIQGANENFEASMDDTFMNQDYWRRRGNNYVKDVVVHSTLLDPYITERAAVEKYKFFTTTPWKFKVDMEDETLERLDGNSIQGLMVVLQKEVKTRR